MAEQLRESISFAKVASKREQSQARLNYAERKQLREEAVLPKLKISILNFEFWIAPAVDFSYP